MAELWTKYPIMQVARRILYRRLLNALMPETGSCLIVPIFIYYWMLIAIPVVKLLFAEFKTNFMYFIDIIRVIFCLCRNLLK